MGERIKKTLNYIEENLDLSFDLVSLARIACLSPSQFHRVFKKETMRTPFQFIEELKMKKAFYLLNNDDTSIQKITSNLGYNDYETFSRAFKRIYKFSPDDLKSILGKLEDTFEGIQKDRIIIASMEVEDEHTLVEKAEELMIQMDISQEDLKDSKMFKILKKTNKSAGKHLLVKNKYEVTDEDKIWKSLLKIN